MFGLVSFIAKAARCHGVEVSNNFVANRGWVPSTDASPERCEEARADMGRFNSSLHLFDWRLGAGLIRWLETRAELPLAWIINKHVSFMLKLPMELAVPEPLASSSEGNTELMQERSRKRSRKF